jgi:hypothetical protein
MDCLELCLKDPARTKLINKPWDIAPIKFEERFWSS